VHYLITGHTGFKGAWLSQLLVAAGHRVSGLALDPVPDALYTTAGVRDLLDHDLRVDIRDGDATAGSVERVAPDVVLHLAAQALVRESYRDPRKTWETNVLGTYNVLDAVARAGCVKAMVVVTTDKVYRNVNRTDGYREDEPLGGADPYSASKAAADLLTQSWIASSGCGTPTAIARAGNVIGGGDVCADRLMADLVAAFSTGTDVHLRYPHAVRPWQHVLDCLAGYLTLAETLVAGAQAGAAFNFGPGRDSFVEVGEVARQVAELWGAGAGAILDAAPELHEAGILSLDATKAHRELGWHNRLSFTEAVSWTVEWSKRTLSGEEPRRVCAEQIHRFVERG
jgi:CDP-glucose 4,6-dehydratase